MIRAFGDGYYADASSPPRWHADGREFAERLKLILASLDNDAKLRIEQSLSVRTSLHQRLRSATQLGKGDAGSMKVTINVSDHIPPPVVKILRELPDALLWVLLHRREIRATHTGLYAILDALPTLLRPDGFRDINGLSEQVIAPAADAVRSLDQMALGRADQVVREILKLRVDVLGAYCFRNNRIELHWVVIWMVATYIGVAPDDLAVVVLAHEMAHFYTHVGQDADGHKWDTEKFHHADDRIVEGLAQFYTAFVLGHVGVSGESSRQLKAFDRLLKEQSEPYTCFREWEPRHPNRGEVVRRALVHVRTQGVQHYDEFLTILERGGREMKAGKSIL